MKLSNKNIIIIIVISFTLITTLTLDLQARNPDLEIPLSITYREEIELWPGNTLEVMLVDQSASDQEDTILASKEWRPEGQFPLETSIELDSSELEINNDYLLVAVIKSENEMPFLTGSMRVPGYHLLIESQINLTVKQAVDNFHAFYTGEEFLAVNFLEEMAQFIYAGRSHILPQLISASGARYGNNEIMAWNKGQELMVTSETYEFTAYQKDFDEIDLAEFTFTGGGQEPAWQLEVKEDELILDFDYAMNQLTIDRDYIRVEREEDKIIYSVMSSFLDLEITVIDQRHFDIMSGELYLYTIEIKAGDYNQNGGAIRLIQKNI